MSEYSGLRTTLTFKAMTGGIRAEIARFEDEHGMECTITRKDDVIEVDVCLPSDSHSLGCHTDCLSAVTKLAKQSLEGVVIYSCYEDDEEIVDFAGPSKEANVHRHIG